MSHFLVGRTCFQNVVYVVVLEQLAVDEIDGKHLTRAEPTLGDNVTLVIIVDANLGCDCNVPILRDDVARRAQTVTIEAARRVSAVRQHDAGRSVPGLQLAIEKLVKGANVGVYVVDGLPGRRQQYTHCLDDVHAAGTQHFQHVVETGRVGSGQGDYRVEIRDVVKLVRNEILGPRLSPVAISAYRVDLTVVGEKAERLGELPLRQGVGREALVKYAHRRRHLWIAKVRVELRQSRRHDHALVADRDGRQAGDIGPVVGKPVFGTTPGEKQPPVERSSGQFVRRVNEDLLDSRHRSERFFATSRRISRNFAPPGNAETGCLDRRVDDLPLALGDLVVVCKRKPFLPRTAR